MYNYNGYVKIIFEVSPYQNIFMKYFYSIIFASYVRFSKSLLITLNTTLLYE